MHTDLFCLFLLVAFQHPKRCNKFKSIFSIAVTILKSLRRTAFHARAGNLAAARNRFKYSIYAMPFIGGNGFLLECPLQKALFS